MKSFSSLLIGCMFFTFSSYGQIPRTISYQGILQDTLGNPKPDGSYNFTFRLYPDNVGGTPIWIEQKSLQVRRGLFATQLGDIAPLAPGVAFDRPYWLSLQIAGGSELFPRLPLSAVGYSLNAVHADTADVALVAVGDTLWRTNGYDVYRQNGNVGIGTTSPQEKLHLQGSMLIDAGTAGYGGLDIRGESPALALNNGTQEWDVVSWYDNTLRIVKLTGTTFTPVTIMNNTFQDALVLGSAGVGIGTASPTQKLEVAGTIFSSSGGYRFPDGTVQTTAAVGSGGLTLPYAGSTNSSSIALSITNTGLGEAGRFTVDNPSNGAAAVFAASNGGAATVNAHNTGTGRAGYFSTDNSGNTNNALEGVNNGSAGAGVSGSGLTGVSGYGTNNGMYAFGIGQYSNGLLAVANDANSDAVHAASINGLAGNFIGNVSVSGTLSKGAGSFKIDHPLDPANKYLYHSFVESPDMMNIYNGNVVLDGNGEATVELPVWFEALNKEFRYQLTCIGGFAPVYVAQEISGHRFKISGGRRGLKVSWQVTGIRHDAYANAHRIPVEETKPANEHGFYLHPDLFGQREERGIDWAKNPEMMKRLKADRDNARRH